MTPEREIRAWWEQADGYSGDWSHGLTLEHLGDVLVILDAERQAHARVRAALVDVIHHVRTPGPLHDLWDAVYAADAALATGSGEAGDA